MLLRNLSFTLKSSGRSFLPLVKQFRNEQKFYHHVIEKNLKVSSCYFNLNHWRGKYTKNLGVKGIRNRKNMFEAKTNIEGELDDDQQAERVDDLNLEDSQYEEVAQNAMHVSRDQNIPQNVLIIQPYVKWGTKRNAETSPDDKLKEAEALVRSLPNWNIAQTLKVPLESLEKKTLFGTGKMQEIKTLVQQLNQQKPLTCLFVSKGSLSFAQKRLLEAELKLPIMDRYSIVIQILRLHATSAEARLQVAMAELPYIWAQAKDINPSISRKQGWFLNDAQREILKGRERKLKTELEKIRSHRKLLRNKRRQKNYPVVAVVGYTNAGKTSLIKALTDEKAMQPLDQLFATLDVTAHAGMLPCNLQVIYMDTVGFMSDLPTGLIECFIATLEDAMLADVIVHVQDLSHECHDAQKRHVETTLETLITNLQRNGAFKGSEQCKVPPIINVGNKIDILSQIPNNLSGEMLLVSSKEHTGLNNLLDEIEHQILSTTGRRKIRMRVRNGGNEMAWLYKNAAVMEVTEDTKNAELLLMEVVISESAMGMFKKEFCQ